MRGRYTVTTILLLAEVRQSSERGSFVLTLIADLTESERKTGARAKRTVLIGKDHVTGEEEMASIPLKPLRRI